MSNQFDPRKDEIDSSVFWSVFITIMLIIVIFVYSTINEEEEITPPQPLTKEQIIEKIKER